MKSLNAIFSVLSFIIFCTLGQSQTIENIAESELKSINSLELKSKLLNSENPNNYDVTRYDLSFDLTDTSHQFYGVSKVYATILSETETILLDAQNNLNITQVKINNQTVSFVHNTSQLLIPLDKKYNIGDTITIEAEYTALYDSSPGITLDSQGDAIPLITTLSEPYNASSWWIGADNLADKADEVHLYVKHNAQYKVGSNGKLISSTAQSDGNVITHWQTSYPIPAYLISLAMTNYVEYNNAALVGKIQVPIINYIYPQNDTPEVHSQLDEVPSYVEFYSKLIGDYPYKNEKYGHSQWNWRGGMEHATMTSQYNFGTLLTAHELAHQWFGDKITCATWSDIWLNEGFATYFEGLLRRNLFGEDFFLNWKNGKIAHITSRAAGSVYVPENQLTADRIFDSRLSYNKGAMVLHMLRFKLGDDVFYQAIQNYLEDPKLAYGFATTADLIKHFENQSGKDLTAFFKDWFYGEGFPIFDIQLNIDANKQSGELIVNQESSHSSVDLFETPFEIEFFGLNGESEIRRYDLTQNKQHFLVEDLPFKITDYKFNPGNDIIAKVNAARLGTQNMVENNQFFKIYPNPVQEHFFVLSNNTIDAIKMYDAAGKLVKVQSIQSYEAEISCANLPKGLYMIQAETADGIKFEKMIKE